MSDDLTIRRNQPLPPTGQPIPTRAETHRAILDGLKRQLNETRQEKDARTLRNYGTNMESGRLSPEECLELAHLQTRGIGDLAEAEEARLRELEYILHTTEGKLSRPEFIRLGELKARREPLSDLERDEFLDLKRRAN